MTDGPERGHLLVIAHEATRTGSPVVLLDLLRRSVEHLAVPTKVQLLAEGPLASELHSVGRHTDPHGDPVAILVNSALAAGALLEHPPDVPSAVYVHEVGDALSTLPTSCLTALTQRADVILVVSPAAADDVVALGVPAHRVRVVPPIVSTTRPSQDELTAARRRLRIDPTAQLVVGCGEASWRKGADLFVDVGRRLRARRPVELAWIGRRPRSYGRLLDSDCASVGLSGTLRWVGEVADPRSFLAAADVVVMTSREDPQPMVPLEAAVLGTPTAGFAIGGLRSMSEVGAARAVEYPDTAALADVVGELLDLPAARQEVVRAAAGWVEQHHRPEVTVPLFVDALREILAVTDGGGRGR